MVGPKSNRVGRLNPYVSRSRRRCATEGPLGAPCRKSSHLRRAILVLADETLSPRAARLRLMPGPGIVVLLSVVGVLVALAALSSIVATRFRWRWLVHLILLGLPAVLLALATVQLGAVTHHLDADRTPFIGMATAVVVGAVLAIVVVIVSGAGRPEPPARRWRAGVALGALFLLLAMGAVGVAWRDQRVLTWIEERRARNVDVRESLVAAVDPQEDAWPVYQETIRYFGTPKGAGSRARIDNLVVGRPFDPEHAREVLERMADERARLFEATTLAHCSIGPDPRTFRDGDRPSIRGITRIAGLLEFEVRLAAYEGDPVRAEEALRAMARFADHVAQSPTLFGSVWRESVRNRARKAYCEAGASIDLEPACLESRDGRFRRAAIKRALSLDRVVASEWFLSAATGDSNYRELTGLPPQVPPAVARWIYRNLVLERDIDMVDRYFDELTAAFDRPTLEMMAPIAVPMRGAFPARKLQDFNLVAVEMARVEAQECIPAIAAAVRRFERRHGRWPTSLDELVPADLDAVPIDLLSSDRAPMSMSLVNDNLVIYSVGEDGVDDGGALHTQRDVGVTLRPGVRPVSDERFGSTSALVCPDTLSGGRPDELRAGRRMSGQRSAMASTLPRT